MEEKQKARIDWFMADVLNVEVEINEDVLKGLIVSAMEFLKANPGGMPWEKWSLLSQASRVAFSEAAEQLKVRNTLDVTT